MTDARAVTFFMAKRSVVVKSAMAVVAAAGAGWFTYRAITAQRVSRETDTLAGILALVPTSHVADVGAGDGAYAIELASRVVTKGRVYATEIEADAVANIRDRALAAHLDNVTAIHADEGSANLPTACCEGIFLRGVYHHITKPAETNQSLAAALRPGGRLAIIDFEPTWFLSTFFPVRGVPANRGGHGVSPAVIVSEIQQAGLKLVDSRSDWARGQYCLIFQKQQLVLIHRHLGLAVVQRQQ
jgi:SAM-dependent methyltransferase